MILIGQYDSPFVRRVAIALRLYGLPFEHRPWSTFREDDKIAPYNPLRREAFVPISKIAISTEANPIIEAILSQKAKS